MDEYGFITVRTTSSRLKEKCLLPFGEQTVIEHVIDRALHFNFIPVICTTTNATDNILETIANKHNVCCFRGSEKDKLKRWLDCCNHFSIDSFVSIDADDPFFDEESDHHCMKLLHEQQLDAVYPPENIYVGSVGYALTRDIINRACKLKSSDDTEMMWYYLEKVPDLKKTVLPVFDVEETKIRLTLDYEEDYWMLVSVLRMLDSYPTRRDIEQLFIRNPDLHKINWFRNQQWKQGQLEKKI